MLTNPQIAKITAAKKRRASHHGIWITLIPSDDEFFIPPHARLNLDPSGR